MNGKECDFTANWTSRKRERKKLRDFIINKCDKILHNTLGYQKNLSINVTLNLIYKIAFQ